MSNYHYNSTGHPSVINCLFFANAMILRLLINSCANYENRHMYLMTEVLVMKLTISDTEAMS